MTKVFFCSTCPKLKAFLVNLKLEHLQEIFDNHGIDFECLSEMTGDELREIGIWQFGFKSKIKSGLESQCFFAFDNCALSSFNKCYFEDIRLLSQYYPVCDHCSKRL